MTHPQRCETCHNKDDCDEYESQAVRDISKRCGLCCHSSAPVPEGYIITEEQLQEVYEHCDWGMTNWTKFKNKLRPHQDIFRDVTVGTSGANRFLLDEGIPELRKQGVSK